MSRIEKAVIKPSKESASLRDLLTYQEAYKEAVKGFHEGSISLVILKACEYAVKNHAKWMLDKVDSHYHVIDKMSYSNVNWSNTVYYLMDYIPSLKTLIEKHIDEAD